MEFIDNIGKWNGVGKSHVGVVRISLECGIVCCKWEREMGWGVEDGASREVFLRTTVAIACLYAYRNDPVTEN